MVTKSSISAWHTEELQIDHQEPKRASSPPLSPLVPVKKKLPKKCFFFPFSTRTDLTLKKKKKPFCSFWFLKWKPSSLFGTVFAEPKAHFSVLFLLLLSALPPLFIQAVAPFASEIANLWSLLDFSLYSHGIGAPCNCHEAQNSNQVGVWGSRWIGAGRQHEILFSGVLGVWAVRSSVSEATGDVTWPGARRWPCWLTGGLHDTSM